MEDWKRRQWVVKPDLLSLTFTLCFFFSLLCFVSVCFCECIFVSILYSLHCMLRICLTLWTMLEISVGGRKTFFPFVFLLKKKKKKESSF